MDGATLLNPKSTILLFPPSIITRQLRRLIANYKQTDKCRLLPHMWTIMLKLHLVDLLPTLRQIQWQIEPMELKPLCMAALVSTVEGETNSGPSSILLIPAITACRDEIFSKFTVVHTKMGHVSKTTPLLGVICHPFGKTWYSLPLYKVWEL